MYKVEVRDFDVRVCGDNVISEKRKVSKENPLQAVIGEMYKVKARDLDVRVCGDNVISEKRKVSKENPLQAAICEMYKVEVRDFDVRVCGDNVISEKVTLINFCILKQNLKSFNKEIYIKAKPKIV